MPTHLNRWHCKSVATDQDQTRPCIVGGLQPARASSGACMCPGKPGPRAGFVILPRGGWGPPRVRMPAPRNAQTAQAPILLGPQGHGNKMRSPKSIATGQDQTRNFLCIQVYPLVAAPTATEGQGTRQPKLHLDLISLAGDIASLRIACRGAHWRPDLGGEVIRNSEVAEQSTQRWHGGGRTGAQLQLLLHALPLNK